MTGIGLVSILSLMLFSAVLACTSVVLLFCFASDVKQQRAPSQIMLVASIVLFVAAFVEGQAVWHTWTYVP